ncbi:MAG: hypothetical protein ABI550_09560, partial [Ignavibacteriaceae bacterium]
MKLIKTLNFFWIFFAAIFSFVLLKCSSSNLQDEMNIPKAVIENSNQLIISKTGKDFFYKNFSIDPEKSQAVKNNYLITYKFKIQGKSFVDEEISCPGSFDACRRI